VKGRLAKRLGAAPMIGTVLLIVLILLLIGALPSWPHSRSWGYYPSGGLGLVVIIVLILLLMGHV
jgi:asparagine N-glycosylation enzyme membrane subunit Stt3